MTAGVAVGVGTMGLITGGSVLKHLLDDSPHERMKMASVNTLPPIATA